MVTREIIDGPFIRKALQSIIAGGCALILFGLTEVYSTVKGISEKQHAQTVILAVLQKSITQDFEKRDRHLERLEKRVILLEKLLRLRADDAVEDKPTKEKTTMQN